MGKLQLKKNVYLVDRDRDTALFLAFGRRVYLQGEFVTPRLVDFVRNLERPISLDDLLVGSDSEQERALRLDLLSELARQGFLEEISLEPAAQLATGSLDEGGAGRFGWFDGFSSFLYQSAGARQRAIHTLASSRVGVIDLGLSGGAVLHALDRLGLEELYYFASERVSPDAIAHSTGRFRSEDAGLFMHEAISREKFVHSRVVASPMGDPVDLPDLDFYLVVGTWFDRERICAINSVFQARRQRWLSSMEDSYGGSIGPEFGIEDGPCFQCIADRLDSNLMNFEKHAVYERYSLNNKLKERLLAPPVYRSFHELLALELVKSILRIPGRGTATGMTEIDFWNLGTAKHRVHPTPFCPVCSVGQAAPLAALDSGSPKAVTEFGDESRRV